VADILVRDVPDRVVASIDAHAARLGISRSEYIRRTWLQEVSREEGPVARRDLELFAETFRDLGDPDVMSGA
jgi:plasmid stability protein